MPLYPLGSPQRQQMFTRLLLRAADAHHPHGSGLVVQAVARDSTLVLLPKYWEEINVARVSGARYLEGADIERQFDRLDNM
jgi:hypothetical protein